MGDGTLLYLPSGTRLRALCGPKVVIGASYDAVASVCVPNIPYSWPPYHHQLASELQDDTDCDLSSQCLGRVIAVKNGFQEEISFVARL